MNSAVIVIEWIALIIITGNKNKPFHSLKYIMGNQDNMARKSKVCMEFQRKILLYQMLPSQTKQIKTNSQWDELDLVLYVIIYSLEFLKYSFFCLHTFSVILCLWNYRKCMAETLFKKYFLQ